jgi:hypothetical protein
VQGGTGGTTTGLYYPATNQLALATNGTQALLVDSSQNVGIGTASPGYKLDVYGGASGTRTDIVARNASANCNVGVLSDNNGFVSSTNSTLFYTNASERMRIDASGNVGIGVTPSAWATLLPVQVKNGYVAGYLNRMYVGANNYYDGSNSRYIATDFATRYYQVNGIHAWEAAPSGTAGNAITFTQVLAVEKAKSLALEGATSVSGTGITFPATQSASSNANTLDDYEEGTVTYPLILGGSTITSGYSQNSCKYVKIGNSVNCVYLMDYTGSSGVVTITLPFAVDSTQAILIISSVYSNQYGYTQQCLFFNASSATAALNTGIDPNTPFTLATGNRLYIRASFLYLTN